MFQASDKFVTGPRAASEPKAIASTPETRYALHYAPAATSRWWQDWSAWLGRCAENDHELEQPFVDGVDHNEFRQLTKEPRRYGLHATLKAPFRLRSELLNEGDPGRSVPLALDESLSAFSTQHRRFAIPELRVERLGDFLALRPIAEIAELQMIAAACVESFDHLRAPLTEAELARRRQSNLSQEEDALLTKWGYPYVFERFRFHMTLTGSLLAVPEHIITQIHDAAEARLSSLLHEPLMFDAISLFREDAPGKPFRLIRRFPLAA